MGKVIRDIRLTGHRFFMQWDITSQCNFSCSHCYNSETGDDLSYADLINILNQYKDFLKELSKQQRSNYNHVLGLSGGEPFMRSDFFDLIEELHNQQIKYLILTNGYHIDENNVKDLEKFRPSRVQISIDGIEATHDSIRGSGSFAKAVDSGYVKSCHDLSEGGLAVAVAEMAFSGGYGIQLDLRSVPRTKEVKRNDYVLFSESNSRFLVEVPEKRGEDFEALMRKNVYSVVGRVEKDRRLSVYGLNGEGVVNVSLSRLRNSWKSTFGG